jgi:hypothetical protein
VPLVLVSSGKTNRHRLDRGGNRQINAAIHRIAVTRARCHSETRRYLDRKRAEGKSTREAIRCLKCISRVASGTSRKPPPPGPGASPPIDFLIYRSSRSGNGAARWK